MNRLQVSLDISSEYLTLSELSNELGMPPDSGSHSKGEPRGAGEFKSTVWKLFSPLSETTPLQDHIEEIARRFPPETVTHRLPQNCRVFIDIGLIFDGWNSV